MVLPSFGLVAISTPAFFLPVLAHFAAVFLLVVSQAITSFSDA